MPVFLCPCCPLRADGRRAKVPVLPGIRRWGRKTSCALWLYSWSFVQGRRRRASAEIHLRFVAHRW
jgi:hypothetical protein